MASTSETPRPMAESVENNLHEDSGTSATAEPQGLPVSEDEQQNSDEDGFSVDDADSMLAVSIGREQLRLTSLLTPAAERSAALDQQNSWGFFDGPDEEGQQEVLRETLQNTEAASAEPPKLPASNVPLRQQLDAPQRSSWFAGLRGSNRSRGASGPEDGSTMTSRTNANSFFGDVSLRRFLPSLTSIPSLPGLNVGSSPESTAPKHRPSTSLGVSGIESTRHISRRGRSNTLFQYSSPWRTDTISPPSSKEAPQMPSVQVPKRSAVTPSPGPSSQPLTEKKLPLRRSTSLDSFRPILSRKSTLSLLEQDANWDHVTQQVNSRRKAIRDAFQDSLPQMPNLNMNYLRPDIAFKNFWDSGRPNAPSQNPSDFRNSKDHFKATMQGTNMESPPKAARSKCPSLDVAMQRLTGDVVVLGGYRGSVLRETELPQRQLWVPVKVGLNIRRVNLEVGLNPEDEEAMQNHIFASGMLTHIGPVDMGRRLFGKLRGCDNARKGKLRVWDYGYDWRLSPHLLSRRMIDFLEGLPCNKSNTDPKSKGAIIIAHSLGGLVTRHAVNQRPDLFAGVIYAGTPQHAVNILGPLRKGDDVLLSSKVLTARVNFSFRTSFLLLPESGHCFVDKTSKKEYVVDFFDAQNWQRYALSPCVATVAPSLNPTERKSIFGTLYNSLPSLLASNTPGPLRPSDSPSGPLTNKIENIAHPDEGTVSMQMQSTAPAARTSALPVDDAMAYLKRTLAEVRQFKTELQHKPKFEADNRYPPHALVYCTSIPTVYGARVASRDAIKHADAYDELAFASGDGVVLARAAMMPRGYQTVRDGRVQTERGHVCLLADLEAVGKCLVALQKGRDEGIGLGKPPADITHDP